MTEKELSKWVKTAISSELGQRFNELAHEENWWTSLVASAETSGKHLYGPIKHIDELANRILGFNNIPTTTENINRTKEMIISVKKEKMSLLHKLMRD